MRRSMDPDRPPVAVREPDPALTERILGTRWDPLEDARSIVRVDLQEVRMLDHLFDVKSARRRLVTCATDRDRKRLDRGRDVVPHHVETPLLSTGCTRYVDPWSLGCGRGRRPSSSPAIRLRGRGRAGDQSRGNQQDRTQQCCRAPRSDPTGGEASCVAPRALRSSSSHGRRSYRGPAAKLGGEELKTSPPIANFGSRLPTLGRWAPRCSSRQTAIAQPPRRSVTGGGGGRRRRRWRGGGGGGTYAAAPPRAGRRAGP